MEKFTKFERNRLIGGCIGLVLCIVLIIYTSHLAKIQHAANLVSLELNMKTLVEAGYAQGQADALKGIIRIRMINDSTYTWISSPWGAIKTINDTIHINITHK